MKGGGSSFYLPHNTKESAEEHKKTEKKEHLGGEEGRQRRPVSQRDFFADWTGSEP